MRTDPTEHPRPLLRRDWTALDGRWDFAADPERRHVSPGTVEFDGAITVPYAPETPASGVSWKGALSRVWYRRRLPAAEGDLRTVLHFGAVDRVADVWVGGAHVAHHEGGYTPFSVDVTDQLTQDADVVVRADDDPSDIEAPRGKQDWRDDPHYIWYPRTTGIWRRPWLEQVAAHHVADVHWSGDPVAMTVHVRIVLNAPLARHRVHLRLRAGDRLLVDDVMTVDGLVVERTLHIGDGGFEDRLQLLWWPRADAATLLDAEIALLSPDDDVLDEVESYTALRSVSVEDGQFLVNRRPTPMLLVLDQGYWQETGATPADGEALRRDLELTRALGFVGARKHQKTEDPRYFAWADRLGMMAWVEMPSAYRAGPTATDRLLREWPDVVRGHRGHPSVVAWVPVNESWGVGALETDSRQHALVAALAATTHALDGTRPVSANDGWETSGGEILGIHDYAAEAEVLQHRYGTPADLERSVLRRRSNGLLPDLDRAAPGARAAILSEFGGISLRAVDEMQSDSLRLVDSTTTWGYSDARSPEDLLDRYRALWGAVHASTALAGGCWTQLTDTYQEVNGLLRMDRTPKVGLEQLSAATRGQEPLGTVAPLTSS